MDDKPKKGMTAFQAIITFFSVGGIFWFLIGMPYVYYTIGTGAYFDKFSNQFGLILGSTILGSIALAIGIILLSVQWTDINNVARIAIVLTTVALTLSVTSVAVSAITH